MPKIVSSPFCDRSIPYEVMRAAPDKALVRVGDVAATLGVTERFVRRLVDERRIPFLKIGRFVRFDPADVAEWIEASRVEPVRSRSRSMEQRTSFPMQSSRRSA